jgi:hypothetical protein
MARGMAAALAALFVLAAIAGGVWGLRGGPRVSDANVTAAVAEAIAVLRTEWDPRLFVLEATPAASGGGVTLAGVVDRARAAELLAAARKASGGRPVVDRLVRLPDPALGPETVALVVVAVANLGDAPGRAQGEHLVTQARLGDALEVLRERDGWYLVRMTDDGYLGWVDPAGVVRLTPAELAAYSAGEHVLVTAKLADVFEAEGGQVLLRAVMGSALKAGRGPDLDEVGRDGSGTDSAYLAVTLPDGRAGLIRDTEARLLPTALAVWAETRPAAEIIALAERFLGLPYLWGGTTSQGFDCSGFTQFVFGLNGYRLPRDADMQYGVGTPIADRSALLPGDLVFWSTAKAGPSHVGIYIGGLRYIHSRGSAGVTINSFDPRASGYDEGLEQAYIGARRLVAGAP